MDICLVHGVGYHKNNKSIQDFAAKLSAITGATCSLHAWQHPGTVPELELPVAYHAAKLNHWVREVVMDAAHVVVNLDELVAALPPADMYVGHSAGGMICAQKTTVPRVVFGCPLKLWRAVLPATTTAGMMTMRNIMHVYDPLGTTITDAENIAIKDNLWKYFLLPPLSHSGYWSSKQVLDLTVGFYQRLLGD